MNQPETNPEPVGGQEGLSRSAQLIAQRLLNARDKLIDRNLRNRLINTPLDSTRIKAIRVFGESSDQVFATLFSQKRSMAFLPVPDREQQPPLLPQAQEDSEESSSFSYDFSLPSDVGRQEDKYLQTKLGKESLSKKLLSIYYESKEHEEETGVNILFLACGFLKWFEDDNSEVVRFSPLLLLPVILERQKTKGGGFDLRGRDDELMPNISLSVWLDEQFGISLPEIPDDGEWSPTTYFQSVAEVIKKKERWEVLSDDILLGFFSFSKFMMWKDLEPESWPSGMGLSDHPVIQELLKSVTEHSEPASPLIPAEDRIDDHFKPRDLTYVLDADSSQTEAIQTALSGKSMVIQGPPGTGKSQSITNLIASAANKGKTVLFVAEKMAALEVVHRRLEQSGLSELALEIHSRKANKQALHEQLKEALEMPAQASPPMGDVDRLRELQELLNQHADKLNTPVLPWGFTPFELIGTLSKFYRSGIKKLKESIPSAEDYSKSELNKLSAHIEDLCQRLRSSGYPSWTGFEEGEYSLLLPNEVEELRMLLSSVLANSELINVGAEGFIKSNFCNLQEESSETFIKGYEFSDPLELFVLVVRWVDVVDNSKAKLSLLPPTELTGSYYLFDSHEAFEALVEALEQCKKSKEFISKCTRQIWSSVNIDDLNYRLHVHGGRFFSFLSPSYWSVKREVLALFNESYQAKDFKSLAIGLGELCAFKNAKELIKATDPRVLEALGDYWCGEDSDPSALRALVDLNSEIRRLDPLKICDAPFVKDFYYRVSTLSDDYTQREKLLKLRDLLSEVEDDYLKIRGLLAFQIGAERSVVRTSHLYGSSNSNRW